VIKFFKSSRENEFTRQIKPYLQGMYRQAYRLTTNQDDAEDLVQDLLMRLFEKKVDLSEIERPQSWLMRSLYNLFIDDLRKKNHLPIDNKENLSNEIIDFTGDYSKSPHILHQQDYTNKNLINVIKTLNMDQQALISLHDVEGYTLAELSEIMDIPIGTLKSRLHRARQSLRDIISMEPFTEKNRLK